VHPHDQNKKGVAEMKRRCIRSDRGQALVEGSVAVCMIIACCVAACLMVFNSGTGVYFKQKLQGISHLAAQFAAAHAGDSDVDTETQTFVETLMPQVGVTPNNPNVDIEQLSILENPMMKVTVSNTFQVFGGGSLLPSQMTLADSECVVF
jgi:hypothetical protein